MKIEKILKKLDELDNLGYEHPQINILCDGSGCFETGLEGEEEKIFRFLTLKELSEKLDQEIAKFKPKEIEFNRELCIEWSQVNPDEIVYCNNDIHKSISWTYMYILDYYYWLDKNKKGIERLHSARPLKDVVIEWARGRENGKC